MDVRFYVVQVCESRRNELAHNTLHQIEFNYLLESKIFTLIQKLLILIHY